MNLLTKKAKDFRSFVEDIDSIEIAKYLTLLWPFLFVSFEKVYSQSLFQLIAFIGLLFFKRISKNFWFWCLLALAYGFHLYDIMETADNHKWLYSYWLFAVCISSRTGREKWLGFNAQYLLGLTFFFATVWKFLGGEYLDGTFFQLTFMMDSRFQSFIIEMLGYDRYLAKLHTFFTGNFFYDKNLDIMAFANPIEISKANVYTAYFFAFYTILIEGSVAALFLLKNKLAKKKWLSDLALLIFVFTVYLIVPVVGFGALILIMGLVQSEKKMKPFYILGLLFVTFLGLPIK